jgi:diguanylate cyclase (GGDEF)-like protein
MIFSNYRKTHEQLTLLATIDPLTLSGNRRALDRKLSDVIADQTRQPSTVSLLLLDLDLFKKINDEYGHAIGDQTLVEVASLITENTRSLDALYRYGGEEFIIMPLKINLAEAMALAENLRILVENHKFSSHIKLTISVGVAEYRAGETAESWIHRADSALYTAKDLGRNRVVAETEVE